MGGWLLGRARGHDRWILAALLIGFLAAHAVVSQAWQRYHEPMFLLTLIVALSRDGLHSVAPVSIRYGRGALFAFTLIEGGITASQLLR